MPSGRALKAIEVFSKVMNESLRTKADKSDATKKEWDQFVGDELSKRLLRVSEIVNSEAKAIKVKHELLSDDEKSNAGAYDKQFSSLVESNDIPKVYRERLRAAGLEMRYDVPLSLDSFSTGLRYILTSFHF